METVNVHKITTDQKCCIAVFVVIALLSLWMWYRARGPVPVLQEHMTSWRAMRVVNGEFEPFTAADARGVMVAMQDPHITWDVFQAKFAKLKLHPLTFAKLQDSAKKNNLTQVLTAYLIADDHRYHNKP